MPSPFNSRLARQVKCFGKPVPKPNVSFPRLKLRWRKPSTVKKSQPMALLWTARPGLLVRLIQRKDGDMRPQYPAQLVLDKPGRGRVYDSILETIGNTPL